MHSYTVIDTREVTLDNGDLEYLLFLRNPTGNFFLKDYEVWKGDWGPFSDKWTDKVRNQLNYRVTKESMEKAKAKQLKYLRRWAKSFKKPKRKQLNKIDEEENKENDETRINEEGNEDEGIMDDNELLGPNDGPGD